MLTVKCEMKKLLYGCKMLRISHCLDSPLTGGGEVNLKRRPRSTTNRHIFCLCNFEVFMVVTMKNAVFWDVTPCDCCKNRRFGGT
jgi:hypothetical protein